MSSAVLDLPVARVRDILARGYHLSVDDVQVVSGEVATVCRAVVGGRPYAVKAMPVSGDEAAVVGWQTRAMVRLRDGGLPVPAVRPDVEGRLLHPHEQGGRLVLVQVTDWLGDPPLSDVPVDPPLLRAVGDVAARVSLALAGDEPPVATGHPWELVRTAESIGAVVDRLDDPHVAALVAAAVRVFDEQVAPALPDLPWSVVHHDLHDANLLVGPGPDGRRVVTGILDFGDMVRAPRVAELAVAAAYAARNTDDPRSALLDVAAGWVARSALTPPESAVVLPGAIARLATNVAMWASRASGPRAAYAGARTVGAADALEQLLGVDPVAFLTDLRSEAARARR